MDATKEPLNEVRTLLRDFLDEKISAGEFETAFFPAVRILWDISQELVNADPDFAGVYRTVIEGSITPEEFAVQCKDFMAGLAGIEYIPFSEKDEALGHLWVEVDAYREDPSEREQGFHIGEDELRQVVRETLAILEG